MVRLFSLANFSLNTHPINGILLFTPKPLNIVSIPTNFFIPFAFNFAFDTLISHYTNLQEELNINNLKSMEKIVNDITMKEDLKKYNVEHSILTPYVQYKKEKLEFDSNMKHESCSI